MYHKAKVVPCTEEEKEHLVKVLKANSIIECKQSDEILKKALAWARQMLKKILMHMGQEKRSFLCIENCFAIKTLLSIDEKIVADVDVIAPNLTTEVQNSVNSDADYLHNVTDTPIEEAPELVTTAVKNLETSNTYSY
ncbi:hypothetical protein QE152_g38413 [Popillia japonica]|uniref:Uncharacterized protein n=1 Tax=Popillia japonica TaxID=7064 RepID=A0AAW1HXA6_POPJA